MIGIDISDRSVKIAEITGGRGDALRLQSVCWSAVPANLIRRGVIQDIPAVTEALKEAFGKCSPSPVTGDMVVASIPESQSFVRVLDVPNIPNNEMDEAVQWAVRQHIPFDLERVYLDWQALPASQLPKGGRREVLVGAAQRDVVDPLLKALDGANLKVVALELEAQAIVRSLLPRDSSDVRGVLIIDLGATSTNVIYFNLGTLRFTASVQLGGDDLTQQLANALQIRPDIAAEKKTVIGAENQGGENATVAMALRGAALNLLQRVEKVVREMTAQSQADQAVRAILLSGGTANLPGIKEVVAEVFPGVPVQLGNPWTNILVEAGEQSAPLSPADASHFVTSFGLALRNLK